MKKLFYPFSIIAMAIALALCGYGDIKLLLWILLDIPIKSVILLTPIFVLITGRCLIRFIDWTNTMENQKANSQK